MVDDMYNKNKNNGKVFLLFPCGERVHQMRCEACCDGRNTSRGFAGDEWCCKPKENAFVWKRDQHETDVDVQRRGLMKRWTHKTDKLASE